MISNNSGKRLNSRSLVAFVLIGALAFGSACASLPTQKEAALQDQDTVILLHGMWRNKRAMVLIEDELKKQGYNTINISYPSTDYTIEELAVRYLHPVVREIQGQGKIHFVTHSMGGILTRYYLDTHKVDKLGRVVMIAPPNKGVEMAERFGDWTLVQWATGPAGQQLSSGELGMPRALGPVKYELGVIAGTKGRNMLSCMIPGEDDGLVSVESTKVKGMRDFLTIDQNHYFIKRDERAIRQTVHFLSNGRFLHEQESDTEKEIAQAL